MRINSIQFENFRQFNNERIEFLSDSENKVSVVYGRNYIGKTTLVKALLWCLYSDDKSFDDDPIHVNKDIQESCLTPGKEITSSVTIDLDHNGFSYTIKTSQKFIATQTSVGIKFTPLQKEPFRSIFKVDFSGMSIPVPHNDVDREIESILPSNLRNYFFYDGENNKIDTVSNKTSLREAVRNIMNLNAREELIKVFSSSAGGIKSRFTSQIQSANPERNDEILEEIDKLSAQIENDENNNAQAKKDIDELRQQAEELEAKIEENSEAEQYQRQLINGRKELADLRDTRDELFGSLCRNMDSLGGENPGIAGLFIAIALKSKDLGSQFEDVSISKKSYSHQSESSVDEIIKKGVCICGQPITFGDEHYQHLIEIKEFLAPHDYSAMLKTFLKTYNVKYQSAGEAGKAMHKTASQLKKVIQEIERQIETNTELEKKLADFTGDVGKWRRDATELIKLANEKEVAVNYNENFIIPPKKARIEKLRAEQSALASASDKNKKIQKYCDYIDAVYKLSSKRLDDKKAGILNALTEQTNEVFQGILDKKEKTLFVDPDSYNVEIRYNGAKIKNSTAEGIAKNLGFVAGLIYLAKNKNLIGSGDGDDDLPDDYPLFIDAPFSALDAQNVRNAASILPKYCSQLVITLLDKDYDIAKDQLKPYINKTYHLTTNATTTVSKFDEEE